MFFEDWLWVGWDIILHLFWWSLLGLIPGIFIVLIIFNEYERFTGQEQEMISGMHFWAWIIVTGAIIHIVIPGLG